MVLNNLLRL